MKITLKHIVTYEGEFTTDDSTIAKMAMEQEFYIQDAVNLKKVSDDTVTFTESEVAKTLAERIVKSLPELETLSGGALSQAIEIIEEIIEESITN